MVAGATGIDAFLMVVAADDGVMPQTREHAAVLAGLGIAEGVVAVTKADLLDPSVAAAEARELLGAVEVVPTSIRTGEGLDALRAALDHLAARLPGRAGSDPLMRLHVDRAFTIKGAGTVVTGTLWSGSVGRAMSSRCFRVGSRRGCARFRSTTARWSARPQASAWPSTWWGSRCARSPAATSSPTCSRALRPTYVVDAALDLREEPAGRVQVHHGTREAPARVAALGGRFFQLRLEHPLVAADGDRLIVRRIAPPDTLGGGVVLDAHARKHGPSPEASARLERLARGEPAESAKPPEKGSEPLSGGDSRGLTPPLSAGALALEERLRAAGHEPPTEAELGDAASELPALRAAGRAVRVGRTLHYHPEALAGVERRVAAFCEAHGSITIAQLRDELGTTRKFAQALLEHFDAAKFTRRRGDEHVLRRR